MPIAILNNEADQFAGNSLASLISQWKLPPHNAHLLVSFHAAEASPLVLLSRFTSILAAIIKVSPAVGVYWAGAGATHDSDFFTSIAANRDVVPRIALWSGISTAREKDGRLSLLSLGMKQLNLPDLLLVIDKPSEAGALEMMYDLLGYVAELGEPLPEGDTIGRNADEKLLVHYVPSPIDPSEKVWRVEMP